MNKTLFSVVLAGALLAHSAVTLAHGKGDEHSGTQSSDQGAHGESHSESYPFGHPGELSKVSGTIKVTALDIRFEPTRIAVKAGDTIKFDIANTGVLEHEFLLADAAEQVEHEKEVQATPDMKMDHPNGVLIAPGKTATLIWTFTKPGTLQYGCHVPGHFAAGMVGQLTVN